jgi:hypothetical protein
MAAVARAKTRSMQGRVRSIGFDKVDRARQVGRLRAAQTVSPRDPRQPWGSGPHRNGLPTPNRKGFLVDQLPGKNPGYKKIRALIIFSVADVGASHARDFLRGHGPLLHGICKASGFIHNGNPLSSNRNNDAWTNLKFNFIFVQKSRTLPMVLGLATRKFLNLFLQKIKK